MPTVLHRLARWADQKPNDVGQRFKKDGAWRDITTREYMDRVYWLALFLDSKGLKKTDITAIFSPNCPQWTQSQLASLLLGAKSAGIYPNSISKDVLYVLNHTEAKVLFIKDREFFGKVTEGGGAFPSQIEYVIVFEGDPNVHPKAISFEAALAEGRKLAESGKARSLKSMLEDVKAENGAFMIYTSGTTGNPKGAILSHENLTYTSDRVAEYWRLPMGRGSLFSFLPLCHVAETLQSTGVGISQRYTVNFCTKFDNVAKELPEVQPTLLLCVPRLWEKMMEGVLNKVERAPGPRKKLAHWALGVGTRVAEAKFSGLRASVGDLVQLKIADKLVLSKVRDALGLGKAEMLASGAAALAPHISRWFRTLGLEILEDFGQTESTGVICMTQSGIDMAGTVGKPVPGMEMKLAEDGEILTRGKHVFLGYYKDEANTASVLEGGWLHTGDLGEIDERGLVRIKGRKKEIMKTSGGKMVAPLPVEEELKAAPEISQVCMVGDGRKYLAALITLSETVLADLKARKPDVLEGRTIEDPATVDAIKRYVETLNAKLASYEQIKRFAIISREFSIADGEMTPTLKMKRNVIEKNFAQVIESLYA